MLSEDNLVLVTQLCSHLCWLGGSDVIDCGLCCWQTWRENHRYLSCWRPYTQTHACQDVWVWLSLLCCRPETRCRLSFHQHMQNRSVWGHTAVRTHSPVFMSLCENDSPLHVTLCSVCHSGKQSSLWYSFFNAAVCCGLIVWHWFPATRAY